VGRLSGYLWPLIAFVVGLGAQLSGVTVPWLAAVLFAIAAILLLLQLALQFAPMKVARALGWMRDLKLQWPIASKKAFAAPLPLSNKGLYVGLMLVDFSRVAAELILVISVRAYNGTGHVLFVERPEGHIKVDGFNIVLQTPWIAQPDQLKRIEPRREFAFDLEQRVAQEIADRLAAMQPGDKVVFMLADLNLMIGSKGTDGDAVRLPLWDGLNVYLDHTHPIVSKIVTMVGTITARSSVG
jgi:hypothetical protein